MLAESSWTSISFQITHVAGRTAEDASFAVICCPVGTDRENVDVKRHARKTALYLQKLILELELALPTRTTIMLKI